MFSTIIVAIVTGIVAFELGYGKAYKTYEKIDQQFETKED